MFACEDRRMIEKSSIKSSLTRPLHWHCEIPWSPVWLDMGWWSCHSVTERFIWAYIRDTESHIAATTLPFFYPFQFFFFHNTYTWRMFIVDQFKETNFGLEMGQKLSLLSILDWEWWFCIRNTTLVVAYTKFRSCLSLFFFMQDSVILSLNSYVQEVGWSNRPMENQDTENRVSLMSVTPQRNLECHTFKCINC